MRVAGDVAGCLAAARELARCAATVQSAQDEVRPLPPFSWTGTAAGLHQTHVLRMVGQADGRAGQARAAGRALQDFAEGLARLQERGRQLSDEAAAARLVLDDTGWIAPVQLGADPDARDELLRRSGVRRAVLHGVSALRVDEEALHTGLARALWRDVTPAERVSSPPSPWRPGRGDAPAAILATTTSALDQVADDGLRLVGRVAGSTGAGAAVTAAGEMAAGEEPLDVALNTAVITAGAYAGGGLAAAGMTGVAVLTAPVAVPVAVGVAAAAVGGFVGGYVADRIWDAHGQDVKRVGGRLLSSARLPWVDRPRDGRRRR